MQNNCLTALSRLGRRGFPSSIFRIPVQRDNAFSFSTAALKEQQKEKPSGQSSIADSLTRASPADATILVKGISPQLCSEVKVTDSLKYPYYVKRQLAAALRIKQRASIRAAKDKADLLARIAAGKARQERLSNASAKIKAAAGVKTAAAKATIDAAQVKRRIIAMSVAARVKAKLKTTTLEALKVRTKVSS